MKKEIRYYKTSDDKGSAAIRIPTANQNNKTMRTINCKFKSNGKDIRLTAVISDDLTTLSKSKRNQATDIIDDFMTEEETWIVYFEMNDRLGYEVQLLVNKEGNKTLKGKKAVTWEGKHGDSVITDSQNVIITIR